MRLTHLTQNQYDTRPWKNGKGVTTEIYLAPDGTNQSDFDLRISLAPITESGPFSPFPGVERRITLIEGVGLDLAFDDHVLRLDPFQPQGFDTGLAPMGRPLDGPVRVINVMARRTRWQFTGCKVVSKLDEALVEGDLGVFFAASGTWTGSVDGTTVTMEAHETLLIEGPGSFRLNTAGQNKGIFAKLKPVTNPIEIHYDHGSNDLTEVITKKLQEVGKDLNNLTTTDLNTIDEFHVRARKATLEIGENMGLTEDSRVLDIGSGLGGPARTIADTYHSHVTGIDLTASFCKAANTISKWLDMTDRTSFIQGDATNLPFPDASFDAAMTIHVAMNIAEKDLLYEQAHRVLKPGCVFVAYDIVQGEGGDIRYPVPWARDASISHVSTPDEMHNALQEAGFRILSATDSTKESQAWFDTMATETAVPLIPPLTLQTVLGDDFRHMFSNLRRNLTERRARTMMFVCRA